MPDHDWWVALRKESVDRNNAMQIVIVIVNASLSARRAWIEIGLNFARKIRPVVALRKESVDRNRLIRLLLVWLIWSLSARRAWIEINTRSQPSRPRRLSLSARRAWIEMTQCRL